MNEDYSWYLLSTPHEHGLLVWLRWREAVTTAQSIMGCRLQNLRAAAQPEQDVSGEGVTAELCTVWAALPDSDEQLPNALTALGMLNANRDRWLLPLYPGIAPQMIALGHAHALESLRRLDARPEHLVEVKAASLDAGLHIFQCLSHPGYGGAKVSHCDAADLADFLAQSESGWQAHRIKADFYALNSAARISVLNQLQAIMAASGKKTAPCFFIRSPYVSPELSGDYFQASMLVKDASALCWPDAFDMQASKWLTFSYEHQRPPFVYEILVLFA